MAFKNFKGYLLAAIAAAAYGTNPVFAIPLYEHGMNPNSVLLFRYLIGLPILACVMKARNISFAIRKEEILKVVILGFLMAISSLTLFESYKFMNSGIASTLLFVYPIMVAVLMIFLFHERFKISVGLCLIIMSFGLFLLSFGFMTRCDGHRRLRPVTAYGLVINAVAAVLWRLGFKWCPGISITVREEDMSAGMERPVIIYSVRLFYRPRVSQANRADFERMQKRFQYNDADLQQK